MKTHTNIYIGTVCLEPTRWGKRQPSFAVSDWLPRFAKDGYDGIELWSYHYTRADRTEQQRLIDEASPIAVYNTYAKFSNDAREQRDWEADIITKLQALAVKFNVGNDSSELMDYKHNLLEWAENLPDSCMLLCECHPGTMLETPDAAYAFHADLDPARFGIIVHVGNTSSEELNRWLDTFGSRVQHIHVQFRGPETDPDNPENRPVLDRHFELVRKHGFQGSVTTEFTRGIGKNEDIETIYSNACRDMAYIRSQLS